MRFLPVATLLCLGSALGSANGWTGALVDSECYAALERNVSPTTTSNDVNLDRDWEIRYCHPQSKTKSFALVDHDGQSFKLDSAGNAKAAELVPTGGKKSRINVTVTGVAVTGEKGGNTVKVESISLAK